MLLGRRDRDAPDPLSATTGMELRAVVEGVLRRECGKPCAQRRCSCDEGKVEGLNVLADPRANVGRQIIALDDTQHLRDRPERISCPFWQVHALSREQETVPTREDVELHGVRQ